MSMSMSLNCNPRGLPDTLRGATNGSLLADVGQCLLLNQGQRQEQGQQQQKKIKDREKNVEDATLVAEPMRLIVA